MGEALGRELVASGLMTEEQLESAVKYQSEIGGSLPRIIAKLGLVKEQDLIALMAKREGMEVAGQEELKVDEEIAAKLPRELLEKHDFLPISHSPSQLRLALFDPSDLSAVEEVRFRTGLEVVAVLAPSREIQKALARYYSKGGVDTPRPSHRPKKDVHEVARQVGGLPGPGEAIRAVAEIEASPAKLIKALAALLVEKRVITAGELKDTVRRLEEPAAGSQRAGR